MSRLNDPSQFGDIVVKDQTAQGGRLVRVKDVARIELGAQTYSQDFKLDGKAAAGIAIYQTPDANSLHVAKVVAAKMEELSRRFPPGLQYSIPYNTTIFIKNSINEVYKTLWQAGMLVLIVILVFLQNLRATLVPATTVPVTIIGAFAGMAALGYTVNLSTLFALILAIGIVVDDAIVIVEGVSKYIEQGMSSHDAAIKAMDELFGPIIGITLVLMAVFLPSAFVPGLSGQMFAQFALVIAVTALISAINAATLEADAMRAVAARAGAAGETQPVLSRLQPGLRQSENGYARLIGRMVRRSGLMVLIGFVLSAHRRVGHRAPADRLHPERGPGLSDARGAVAGRGGARPHDGCPGRGDKDRARHAGRPACHRDFGHVRARQFRRPAECRGELCRAQALGRARQDEPHGHIVDRRASAEGTGSGARRQAVRGSAAADPGHRQRRRLCRCSSSCWAAASIMRSSTRSRSNRCNKPPQIRSCSAS